MKRTIHDGDHGTVKKLIIIIIPESDRIVSYISIAFSEMTSAVKELAF